MPSESKVRTAKQPVAPLEQPATSAQPEPAAPAKKAAARTKAVQRPNPAPAAKTAKPKPKPRTVPATAPAAPTTAAPAKSGKKAAKPRPVLVRDSFTMPEADFALIGKLKLSALAGQRAAKKSELLRAGLHLLAKLDTESLVVVLNQLDTVQTGRPKKGH